MRDDHSIQKGAGGLNLEWVIENIMLIPTRGMGEWLLYGVRPFPTRAMSEQQRKIIHIDMDAFYASVEQRDNPALRRRPIAVGGSGRRGVVMTASYEARRFGVHSAMPSIRAARLCPDLVFVRPRFDAYKEASKAIREIFRLYTDLVEPLSLDEAFLDVTEPLRGPASATLIAREIKMMIKEQTHLTASAGVAPNKFLAKIASDVEKPDGLFVITPSQVDKFLADLPIERFFGVGPATAKRFQSLGVHTGADLRSKSREELIRVFGKPGNWYYRIARGIDTRPVSSQGQRKSLSAERTFSEDLATIEDMLGRIGDISAEVARRLERSGFCGRTVVVKIKYHDFVCVTRSMTLRNEIHQAVHIEKVARELLLASAPERPVRLLGVGISKLQRLDFEPSQLALDLGSVD